MSGSSPPAPPASSSAKVNAELTFVTYIPIEYKTLSDAVKAKADTITAQDFVTAVDEAIAHLKMMQQVHQAMASAKLGPKNSTKTYSNGTRMELIDFNNGTERVTWLEPGEYSPALLSDLDESDIQELEKEYAEGVHTREEVHKALKNNMWEFPEARAALAELLANRKNADFIWQPNRSRIDEEKMLAGPGIGGTADKSPQSKASPEEHEL